MAIQWITPVADDQLRVSTALPVAWTTGLPEHYGTKDSSLQYFHLAAAIYVFIWEALVALHMCWYAGSS